MRRKNDNDDQLNNAPANVAGLGASKRDFLKMAVATGVGLGLGGGASLAGASTQPVVTTSAGSVEGVIDEGIYTFKGIRYGADTSGAGRFMPPRKPTPWKGVKPALQYGPACPQTRPGETSRLSEGESEDCLTLNVWTPGLKDNTRRPVMVWLHGGGLWRLSAAGDDQAGNHIADRGDVVMVSPNHRIGVLGFAYLEGLDKKYQGSSLVGMLDLVLALEWVRDNIEAFGGDPENVTIFGQSGGGQKVSLLMAMPSAQGLFHKAIIQSGPAPLTLEAPYANRLASRLVNKLNIAHDSISKLHERSVTEILDKYYEIFDEIGGYGVMGVIQDFAPVAGTTLLPQQPFWDKAPAYSSHVPLMIGCTRTEMTEYTLFADPNAAAMDFALALERLKPIFGDDTAKVLAHYQQHHAGKSAWEVYSLILSDWPTRLYSTHIADVKATQAGAPAYLYRMDWETTAKDGVLMSPHAIDIQFVLGTVAETRPFNQQLEARWKMSDLMLSSWVSFAREGRPTVAGGPDWPAYNTDNKRVFRFDLPPAVTANPDAADLQLLRSMLPNLRTVATYHPAAKEL